MDRRQALARGATLPDRTWGAALFADIAVFTPRTESLMSTLGGRRGGEELTHQLNRVYDALVAEVHRYGGSVLGFSGDAITCWFADGAPAGAAPPPATLRATASALAMQQAMAQFATVPLPGGGTVTLAMHAAVAYGPARRFIVGDPAIQIIDVAAGAALDRMGLVEPLAGKGEVILDPEAVAQAGDLLAIRTWHTSATTGARGAVVTGLRAPVPHTPWPPLPADTLSAEEMRPWLLPAVYARLQSERIEFLTELRPVVALFLLLEGIDYEGDDAAGAALDAYVRWVQATLARYEGTLLQFTVDDKGSYFYAAFGAPIAHEDDARRATAAAFELSHPPATPAPIRPLQIGISQGTMRTGAYGGTTCRTYGALGSEVNLASRLMQHAAPGQVLASERVRLLTSETFRWEALPPIRVKGRSSPVAVYALHGPADPVKAAPPAGMIGRAAEQAVLTGALHKLRQGTGGLLLVEGDPGIGKSRLIAAVRGQAAALEISTFTGSGDAVEQLTPYHAWCPIFSRILDLVPGAAGAAQREHLERRLAGMPGQEQMAPLLGAVLGLDIPDNAITAALAGPGRAENTINLLVAILRDAAAHTPTTIILEDGQWLDSASWALALAVSRRVQPLLLILTTRPLPASNEAPPPDDYTQLRATPGLKHLRLGALAPDDVAAVVAQRLGVTRLPEPVSALIRQRAEGHPFFSEELACALRDAGWISVSGGECRVAPGVDLSAITFPDTLHGVIISRIDRLAPSQQVTLKTASVIGRLFSAGLLHAIHPLALAPEALAGELDVLDRLDLTPLYQREPERAYLFKHVITHEATYYLMPEGQRRPLHRAVAEWYEQTHAHDLAASYPLLAYHWQRALGDAPSDPELINKTIDYMQKAGAQAARNNANPEAVRFYQDALALLARLPETPERNLRELEFLLALVGPLVVTRGPAAHVVREVYDRAYALAEGGAATPSLLPVLYGLIRFHVGRAEYQEARTLADRLVHLAESMGDAEHLGGSHYAGVGYSLFNLGELATARAALEHAIALYDPDRHGHLAFQYGRDPGEGALDLLAIVLWVMGYPDQALERSAQALALAQRLKHPTTLGSALGYAAQLHVLRGEAQAGLAEADTLLTLATEHAAPVMSIGGALYKARALGALGRGAEGLTLFHEGLAIYQSTGAASNAQVLCPLAEICLQAGQIAEGLAAADEGLRVVVERGERWLEAELYRLRGELLLAQNPPAPKGASQEAHAEAERCFAEALAVARRQDAKGWELRAAVSLGRLRLRQGQRAEAQALVAGVYGWFTEGADTGDLRAARDLLAELAGDPRGDRRELPSCTR
jgi:predicted ATPase/class 3 adenylate cyclase